MLLNSIFIFQKQQQVVIILKHYEYQINLVDLLLFTCFVSNVIRQCVKLNEN